MYQEKIDEDEASAEKLNAFIEKLSMRFFYQ